MRLHVAEAGEGPLVLLLHGFPQFWWTWRHQLAGLADAGFRAVAPDLRGYGASDKPPRGYDLPTLAADVAALVRALGEQDAVVVGHDWGGLLGWTTAALHPRTRAAAGRAVDGAPAAAARGDDRPRGSGGPRRYALRFQLPRLPERRLTRADDDPVADLMQRWSGPAWVQTADFAEAVAALPVGRAHPAGRLRRDGVLPLGGPLAAAPRRAALRPPHGRAGHRADPAAARRARPLRPARHRAAAPAATSPAPTSGARCPASATSRQEEAPDEVTAAIAAWRDGRPSSRPSRAARRG